MPVKKAGQRPLLMVRWMMSIPTGPMGAEMRTPIAIPLNNMCSNKSIYARVAVSYLTSYVRECFGV